MDLTRDLMNLLLLFIFGACLTEAQSIANAPNITAVTPLNSTSFAVYWTITDPNHNYIIMWTNLYTDVTNYTTVPENTSNYTVTGLNGINNYNVSVTANYSGGMIMSDNVTIYDVPDAAPMNIRIPPDDITSESFVVQWDAVMDFFTVNYTVRWYRGDNEIGMASVDGLSYTVTGLTANTSYNATVAAINTCCGAGPYSDVIMTMTNMSPPPGGSAKAALCNGAIIATACVITFIMTLLAA